MTATREIPHGTRDGYNLHGCRCQKCWAMMPHGTVNCYGTHRCRCDACKAAKATYVRERGYNRRVGAVAKRKRRADLNLRHPCESCGALCERQARLCDACRRAAVRAARDARRTLIQQRWLAGESYRQIGVALGTTPGAIGIEIVKMRRAGWNVPRRGPGGKVLA